MHGVRRVYDAVGHLAQIFYLGKNFNEQIDCNVRVSLMSKFFTTWGLHVLRVTRDLRLFTRKMRNLPST